MVCNLYHLKRPREAIVGLFAAEDRWPHAMAKPYVAPGQEGPVVIARDGQRLSGLMVWGVPHADHLVTNVRNLDSPFWTGMLERPHHRCLVPATEFEEWSATPDPATGKKVAHWYAIPSRPMFAFAGIWRKVEGQPRFAFLTTEANALVGAVHPKAMPVILEEQAYDRWLNAPWPDAAALVAPYPSQLMVHRYTGRP